MMQRRADQMATRLTGVGSGLGRESSQLELGGDEGEDVVAEEGQRRLGGGQRGREGGGCSWRSWAPRNVLEKVLEQR